MSEPIKVPPLTEERLAEIKRRLDEENAKAVKCWCGQRCDPPYGNGVQCMICASRPTAECMRIIVY